MRRTLAHTDDTPRYHDPTHPDIRLKTLEEQSADWFEGAVWIVEDTQCPSPLSGGQVESAEVVVVGQGRRGVVEGVQDVSREDPSSLADIVARARRDRLRLNEVCEQALAGHRFLYNRANI